MIRDEVWEKNKNKMIEVLIEDGGVSVWIMAVATDLRIMNNLRELVKVKALRVRIFRKVDKK